MGNGDYHKKLLCNLLYPCRICTRAKSTTTSGRGCCVSFTRSSDPYLWQNGVSREDDVGTAVGENVIVHIYKNFLSCEDKLTKFRWNNIRVLFVTRTISDTGGSQVLAARRRVEQRCVVGSWVFLDVWLATILVSARPRPSKFDHYEKHDWNKGEGCPHDHAQDGWDRQFSVRGCNSVKCVSIWATLQFKNGTPWYYIRASATPQIFSETIGGFSRKLVWTLCTLMSPNHSNPSFPKSNHMKLWCGREKTFA